MKLGECPVRATVDVIEGKWKPMIIKELKRRPLRFGRLLRALPDASRKVVTEQLRELEREQIVARKVLSGNRLDGVEYSITRYGRTLIPVLQAMAKWGTKHKRRIPPHDQEEHHAGTLHEFLSANLSSHNSLTQR